MQHHHNKWHTCDRCGKNLSSYRSLWRHKQKCPQGLAPYIPTFDGSEFGSGKPKSQETMDKLERLVLNREEPKKVESKHFAPFSSKTITGHTVPCGSGYNKPKRTREDIMGTGVEDSSKREHLDEENPKLRLYLDKVVNRDKQDEEPQIKKMMKQTFPDNIQKILDGLNGKDNELPAKNDNSVSHNDESDESETDESGEDESDARMVDETLGRQFAKLFNEDKIGNRWELVNILSAMLYLGDITPKDFQKFNNILLSAKENKVAETNDDETLIQETVEHLTKNDKDKLNKLIEKFKEIDNSDKLQELEKEITEEKHYFSNEHYDRILNNIKALENSEIPKLDILQFKINLNNIRRNHYRVDSILRRLKDIQNEKEFAEKVKSLAREGLVSDETFKKLLENNAALELKNITDILKQEYDLEVGRGLYIKPYF